MRIIAFLILIFSATISNAQGFNIKTASGKDGSTLFYLQSEPLASKETALQLQKTLESKIDALISVQELEKNKAFLVEIGPVNNYQTIRQLKDQLLAENLSPRKAGENKPGLAHAEDAKSEQKKGQLWNLRNADIRAVIAEISRVTGKNFVIDPRVQGKISIVSSKTMSEKELYQVFLSMLQVSGYAAIPTGGVIKIVPNIDAKTQAPDLLSQMRTPPRGEEMMVEVIPVQYVPSEQLVPVLRPLMPQWSHVSAYAPSNMIILAGRANNIRRLAGIIKQVDSSSASDIDVVPLKNALAMDVANTLKDLVKAQPGTGGMRSQTMLAADDRSNAILLSGSKTDRIRLRLLISKLDQQGKYGNNSNTQVVYLSYLRAEDLVPILAGIAQANFSGNVGTTIGTITRPALDSTNPAASFASGTSSSGKDTFGSTPQTASAGTAATPTTTGATTQIEGTTKPSVQIIAEPNTNSVIINAPVSIIRILKSVISQLDIRPAQLLIEALVAEIDQKYINDLGIEWGSDQQTGNPGNFRPGFAIINSKTSLDDFQAQIYALVREHKANILSTPSVVVLDNRQAKILVGKQVSVATTSYPGNAGGTGPANPFTTFDRVNVALHLYVRPQITRGQGIHMQIDQGNDTLDPVTGVTGAASVDNQPVFRVSSIVTSVHVDSGDIVVLGGLAQDSLANNDNRLPILGDIPGLGKLFQRNELSREKRVLLVFIKPIILRNEHDALRVTNEKYDSLREEQLEFVRSQEFYPENQDAVLPPLKEATLPRPFSHPVTKEVIIKKQLPKSMISK